MFMVHYPLPSMSVIKGRKEDKERKTKPKVGDQINTNLCSTDWFTRTAAKGHLYPVRKAWKTNV